MPARLTVVSNGRLVSDRPAAGGLSTTHWRQEKPASTYLISLVAAPLVQAARPVARRPARLLRLPGGQRARAPALRRHARHDGDLHPAHRRAVSLEQVRPGHGRGLHRRHGERGRHDAGRLAARRARLSRPAVVPAVAHPARAGAPVVRQPGDRGELGATTGSTRAWPSSCPASTGARSRARTRRRTTTSRSTGSSSALDARRRMPLAAYNSNNVYPKGALVLEMLKTAAGARAVLGRDQAAISPPRLRQRDERRPPPGGARRHRARACAGSGRSGSTRRAIRRSPSSAYDSAARALTLTVRQTQVDTATADSTGCGS